MSANKPPFDGEWVRLGELCRICSGGTPKRTVAEYWNGGTIPWVKIGDISNKYVTETEEFITDAGLNGSSAKILEPGTLLYSIFASIGAVGILEVPAATNQAIAALSIVSALVDRDYLYHFLKSREALAKSTGRGAAQNNINLSILREMMVPVPSVRVQRVIVDQLEVVLKQIESARGQLESLDALVKSRFVEMFEDGQWKRTALSEVADIQGGLTKNGKRDLLPLKLPYLRVANVLRGTLHLDEVLEIGLTAAECEKNSLVEGDLLFVEGNGSADQIGRCAVWDGSIAPCVHQNHLIRVRFDERVLPVYALAYFNAHDGREQIVARAVNTSGLFTLSTGKVKALQMPLPPVPLPQEFADFVNNVDKSRFIVQQKIEKLQMLYDSLAQEYFG